MLKFDNTPSRTRTVLEDAYTEAGYPDFQFSIPQPFQPEHVAGVAELGASPVGVANQLNQVLAENLCNNIAARVRSAVKNSFPLPTQEDMDALYAAYDFSGTRQSSTSPASLFDRIFYKLCGQFIKKLLKKKGYRDLPAPVSVAKRDEEPAANQISYEDFEVEVGRLVGGDGPWAEVQAFIDVRNSLIDDAKLEEAAIREREVASESKLAALSM